MPEPCSQPPSPLPFIGSIVGIIHWFDLIGLLVEIVEQSVVFTVPFNDWNESGGKGVGEEEQGTCQHGSHKQNGMFSMEVLSIEPHKYITIGQVDCGISLTVLSNLEYESR